MLKQKYAYYNNNCVDFTNLIIFFIFIITNSVVGTLIGQLE